jgi:hypothetical protein
VRSTGTAISFVQRAVQVERIGSGQGFAESPALAFAACDQYRTVPSQGADFALEAARSWSLLPSGHQIVLILLVLPLDLSLTPGHLGSELTTG